MDVMGDHATMCAINGQLKKRHNYVQHILRTIAQDAGFDVELEVPCGINSHKIPADLLIKEFDNNGKHYAIDVTIANCTKLNIISQSSNI